VSLGECTGDDDGKATDDGDGS